MRDMIKPAGNMPAAAFFICLSCLFCLLFVPLGLCVEQAVLPDLEGDLKESATSWHVDSLSDSKSSLVAKSQPSREEIILDGNNSAATVADLKAFNSVKERDITCEQEQYAGGSADGSAGDNANGGQFVNSMGVSVSGGQEQAEEFWDGEDDMTDVEAVVDKALNSGSQGDQEHLSEQSVPGENGEKSKNKDLFSNNLDIDVHGITVSAVNTMEGGSAVATSNIIIKPVQIIFVPSEVDEKLK